MVLVACRATPYLSRRRRKDQVTLEANQVVRQGAQALDRLGPSEYDIDILALDVAMLAQACSQCAYPVRRLGRSAVVQISDLVDLRRLLGVGNERSSDDAPTHCPDERPTVHHSMI